MDADGRTVAVIYSGLDWSGAPGPGQGSFLVFAVVHVDETDLPVLETELTAAAMRLAWPRTYVFKHVSAVPNTHREFYQALAHIPFSAHIHMLDKARWWDQYGGKGARGDVCICDGITTLLLQCPPAVTSDQTLYIDLPHKERTTIQKYREVIRSGLRGADRRTFRHIKARADNRRDGGIIQIADMLAGEVAELRGIGGPYLPGIKARVALV
jgi:hypothetical protein